jgi:hypothetical protein
VLLFAGESVRDLGDIVIGLVHPICVGTDKHRP